MYDAPACSTSMSRRSGSGEELDKPSSMRTRNRWTILPHHAARLAAEPEIPLPLRRHPRGPWGCLTHIRMAPPIILTGPLDNFKGGFTA